MKTGGGGVGGGRWWCGVLLEVVVAAGIAFANASGGRGGGWWWPQASRSQMRAGGEGVGVPAPVCTRPPARRSCLCTPTRLCAFAFVRVCLAYPACLFALAHAGPSHLCTPTLARTDPVARAGPCLFSVSRLPPPLPLLLVGHHMVSISNT